MPDFSPDELATIVVALDSAANSARDEERALSRQLGLGHYDDEGHRRVVEEGRAEAAFRAYRYFLLAERIRRDQRGG